MYGCFGHVGQTKRRLDENNERRTKMEMEMEMEMETKMETRKKEWTE